MNNDNVRFTRDLTKGKIAETIFWMMFRDDERFFILPFGYEHLIPELTRYRKSLMDAEDTIKKIASNPDFILISADKKHIRLVDVKFRWDYSSDYRGIRSKAKKTLERWGECFYFIATPKGFYYDSCKEIEANNGMAASLSLELIDEENQKEYLRLLKEFLQLRIVKNQNHPSILCKCSNCNKTIEFPVKNTCPHCNGKIIDL